MTFEELLKEERRGGGAAVYVSLSVPHEDKWPSSGRVTWPSCDPALPRVARVSQSCRGDIYEQEVWGSVREGTEPQDHWGEPGVPRGH